MHRASSRVLATTSSHLVRCWRGGMSGVQPLTPLQRSFAAVAIAPVEGFTQVASSAETTTRDGSKDKPDEEWQKMVEVRSLCAVSVVRAVLTPPLSSGLTLSAHLALALTPFTRLPSAHTTGR